VEVTVSLQGSLDSFALPDVLLLLAGTKKSGELLVVGSGQHGTTPPGIEGRLWFDVGRMVGWDVPRAVDAPDAVFELLRLAEGTFSFGEGTAPSPTAPTDMEPVLTEAQGRLAEWREIERVVPSPAAWLGLSPDPPGADVAMRGDQWRLVVAIGGGCSVDAAVSRLGLGELGGCRAVKEMVESGLVTIGEAAVAEAPRAERVDALGARRRRTPAADRAHRAVPAGNAVAEGAQPAEDHGARAAADRAPWLAPDPEPVLDLLAHLVDKSLVVAEEQPGGSERYRLLETLRQYAEEKLAAAGEVAAMRERHLAWCLILAETAEPGLQGPEQVAWLAVLEREHDNLRAALAWGLQQEGSRALGVQLAAALGSFWERRGYLAEGRRWLERALAEAGTTPPGQRARALGRAGTLEWYLGEYERARVLYDESLILYRTLGDEAGVAAQLSNLGALESGRGNYAEAQHRFEEGLDRSRHVGSAVALAEVLSGLGLTLDLQGQHRRAQALHDESLALQRQAGNTWGIARSLYALGHSHQNLRDLPRARTLYEESLALYRELGGRRRVAFMLIHLGAVAFEEGDDSRAQAHYEESLALARQLDPQAGVGPHMMLLADVAHGQGDEPRATSLYHAAVTVFRELGDKPLLTRTLRGLARVAAIQGQLERAARLFGAVEASCAAMGVPLTASGRVERPRDEAAMRAALDTDAGAAARGEGQAMSLEQAVAYALEEGDPASPSG